MPRHGKDEGPGLIERLRAQLAEMTAERDKLQQHLEARQELDQMLMAGISAPAADGTGPIARVQGPRAQGHRIPREARWLKVVPGFVLAALIGLKAALRHAWIAHPVATAATGAGTFSAVALMTAVTVVPGAVAHDHSPAAAGIPGWHTTASPIPVPSTGPSIAAFVNRAHLPGLDVRTGVDSNPDLTPLPYYYAPPVSSQPSSSSQQAPPSQQSAQSGPAVLQVPVFADRFVQRHAAADPAFGHRLRVGVLAGVHDGH